MYRGQSRSVETEVHVQCIVAIRAVELILEMIQTTAVSINHSVGDVTVAGSQV